MTENEFPLSLKKEWKPPKFYIEYMWLDIRDSFKEITTTFRTTKNLELVAVGDEVYTNGSYRVLTLVFKEVKNPKPLRRAFSLKKEWELKPDNTQTLDTIKD